MFERLDALKDRYEELTEEISQPEVIAQYSRYQSLVRERSGLQMLMDAYAAYRETDRHLREAKELLEDPDLAAEARVEAERLEATLKEQEGQLRLLLVPPDPLDSRNVILELRAGTGGEEAALFAGDLMRMYLKYADRNGLQASILSLSDTDLGGVNEATLMIRGTDAFARFKFESGVHCVKRVPVTESGGRIHTSTATVAVLPEMEERDFEINPTDLQIDTFRASGAGGQHVNKTESAIRVTHLPTGLVVECQDERSQHKNRDRALKILRSRLADIEREKQEAALASERKSQVGTGDRSERIRTYNFPQGRVTDHRIGLTLYKLEQILNGDLDEVIDALVTSDQAEKLKGEQNE